MYSIDPNISHRGIENPQKYALKLLNLFGLESNSVVISGYSLKKNIGNDGGTLYYTNENVIEKFSKEYSCQNILNSLISIGYKKFDFVLIDGNHYGPYFENEIKAISNLLKSEGLLAIDDVNNSWPEIKSIFNLYKDRELFNFVASDERIGILKKL